MKKITFFIVLFFCGLLITQAQTSKDQRNTSKFGSEVINFDHKFEINSKQQDNILAGCDVLIVQADEDTPGDCPIQTILQSYGDLGNIDLYEARYGTPTLAELLAYDVIVTWCNYPYLDAIGLGNILADYIDNGGKVINTVWTMATEGNELHGRFIDEDYTAAKAIGYGVIPACLGVYDSGHPIMNGVTNVCGTFRVTSTTLTPNSSLIADWDDGLIFVAVKDNNTVVTINGYVGYVSSWTGQMPDVLHNSILYLCQIPAPVPISNWAIIVGVLLIGAFIVVRYRKRLV